MTAWYNEVDPYAAQWIRNLISANLIAPGVVDERSIVDVRAEELAGYDQCHFFAGLGGWSYALRRAEWSDNRPVWSGSCPCQPFSIAGRKKGFEDPRHLWPVWRGLIAERNPAVVFGENVESAADWVALVHGDLEALGYAVGCVPIEAASAGADHFRDRYWFVGDRDGSRRLQPQGGVGNVARRPSNTSGGSLLGALAHGHGHGSQIPLGQPSNTGSKLETVEGDRLRVLEHTAGDGWGEGWTEHEFRRRGFTAAVASFDDSQVIECPDGKWRRLPPPGVRWLASRLSCRIPKLRALGNAIDPRPATAFIQAYMSCKPWSER